MRTVRDASEEDERDDQNAASPSSNGSEFAKESTTEKELRPIRTAKSNATKNLVSNCSFALKI